MRQFPVRAQVYIWVVVALGCAAFALNCVSAYRDGVFGGGTTLWLTSLGCVVGFFASFLKVGLLMPGQKVRHRGVNPSISLGFVPSLFLLFGLGPFAAMLASVVNVAVMTLYPRRSPYFQIIFSIAAITIAVTAAGGVLHAFGLAPNEWQRVALRGEDAPGLILPALGVTLATAVYSLLNTYLVAAAVALTSGKRTQKVWDAHYRWLIPCYFAGASCAMIAFALAPFLSQHLWASLAAVIVAAPIPGVIFLVYRYHRAQEESSLRHIDELERKNAELERSRADLSRSKDDLEHLYTSTVESLALAIDAKDRYTKEHIQRVKVMAVRIAHRLGVEGDALRALETGALLHDIGKLAIPEHILSKPGRLSDEEFAKVKCHPDMGARILEPVHFPFPVMPIVRGHHERWDGRGYPDGLAGEQIPLGARILAVADVYDALTSDRPYRPGWPRARALEHIRESAGTHFDPDVVRAFLATAEDGLPSVGDAATAPLAAAAPGPVPASARAEVTEEINRASFEYLSLYEISQTASVTLDLPETLTLLANKLRLLFNASSCVLLLAEGRDEGAHAPGVLRCAAASGAAEAALARTEARLGVGPSIGITERVARTRRAELGPYDAHDLEGGDAAGDAEAAGSLGRLRAAMVVPLATDPDAPLLGTVNLYHERDGAFDAEDLRVLQTVSAQVARAIENAREFDRTRRSAMTDALTGLYNARHLAQFLERELPRARADGRPLTVLVLDLDGFKRVNDRFGHTRGNEVLRDLGNGFQTVLRGGDLVARYAGDEFVIVLPGVGPEVAVAVADKIRAVAQRYDGRPIDAGAAGGDGAARAEDSLGGIRIGISIGAASFPRDATDAAALIARADHAMYRDKDARRAAEESAVRHLLADIGTQ